MDQEDGTLSKKLAQSVGQVMPPVNPYAPPDARLDALEVGNLPSPSWKICTVVNFGVAGAGIYRLATAQPDADLTLISAPIAVAAVSQLIMTVGFVGEKLRKMREERAVNSTVENAPSQEL